jgi:hypothetical protein
MANNNSSDNINFTSMVMAGYQGWFATPSNPILNRWSHWGRVGGAPRSGYTGFELYPDLSGYTSEDLCQTGYADLHGGGKSLLFDSDRDGVIDLHFQWMKKNGLDGIALQRFAGELKRKPLIWRNSTSSRVKKFSEKWGRRFYIMYDISGIKEEVDLAALIGEDFKKVLKDELKLLDSPHYARQNDRPVVAIWGLGFNHCSGSKEEAKRTIKELKETHGCYVVGGVPYYWLKGEHDSKPDWLDVYKLYDMLIPWAVGRYKEIETVYKHFEKYWQPDKEFCDAEGIDLQRVIFPGFAWSNWHKHRGLPLAKRISRHVLDQTGAEPNAIPRNAGKFFWAQAYNTARLGTSAFIAMFDEYDEATAIARAATDQSKIPSDQYFLTLDADGTYVSSDFYLRLAGEATRMIKGERPLTEQVPIAPLDYRIHVTHGYRGILGREPDPGGLESYVDSLESGRTILSFCQSLASSEEFKTDRQHLSPEELTETLYKGILERLPDPAGQESTIEAIRNGQLAERAASMINSQEFQNKFL